MLVESSYRMHKVYILAHTGILCQYEPFGSGMRSFATEPSPASVVSSIGAGIDILPLSSSPAVEVISKNHLIYSTF